MVGHPVPNCGGPIRDADTRKAEDAEMKDQVEANKLNNLRRIRVNDDNEEARFSDKSDSANVRMSLEEQLRQLSERQQGWGFLAKAAVKAVKAIIKPAAKALTKPLAKKVAKKVAKEMAKEVASGALGAGGGDDDATVDGLRNQ